MGERYRSGAVNPQGLAPRNEGLDRSREVPHTSPAQRAATSRVVTELYPTLPSGMSPPSTDAIDHLQGPPGRALIPMVDRFVETWVEVGCACRP